MNVSDAVCRLQMEEETMTPKIKRSETKTLDIYFHDLCIESQDEVLEFYGMTDASEGNFELSPLAILEVELDED
jgi:hypothetical protein